MQKVLAKLKQYKKEDKYGRQKSDRCLKTCLFKTIQQMTNKKKQNLKRKIQLEKNIGVPKISPPFVVNFTTAESFYIYQHLLTNYIGGRKNKKICEREQSGTNLGGCLRPVHTRRCFLIVLHEEARATPARPSIVHTEPFLALDALSLY